MPARGDGNVALLGPGSIPHGVHHRLQEAGRPLGISWPRLAADLYDHQVTVEIDQQRAAAERAVADRVRPEEHLARLARYYGGAGAWHVHPVHADAFDDRDAGV